MSVRLITFAVGLNVLISLQSGMDDSSLIGIHRLQRYRTMRLLDLIGNISGQVVQSVGTACAIIFGIELHADVLITQLVDDKAGQVLKGIQRLAAFADENSHLAAVECAANGSLFLNIFACQFGFDIHGVENGFQEIFRCLDERSCFLFGSFLDFAFRLRFGRLMVLIGNFLFAVLFVASFAVLLREILLFLIVRAFRRFFRSGFRCSLCRSLLDLVACNHGSRVILCLRNNIHD